MTPIYRRPTTWIARAGHALGTTFWWKTWVQRNERNEGRADTEFEWNQNCSMPRLEHGLATLLLHWQSTKQHWAQFASRANIKCLHSERLDKYFYDWRDDHISHQRVNLKREQLYFYDHTSFDFSFCWLFWDTSDNLRSVHHHLSMCWQLHLR